MCSLRVVLASWVGRRTEDKGVEPQESNLSKYGEERRSPLDWVEIRCQWTGDLDKMKVP